MNPNSLEMPFLGFLMDISLRHFKAPHRFDSSTFFWSLSRLFECYQRIIPVCQNYKGKLDDPFLAQDIENFIIRHNVLLNDLAFILKEFYSQKELRGMGGPSGNVVPRNKEQSFNDFLEFFANKNTSLHPELSVLLQTNLGFFRSVMRKRRSDILHYKAKAFVFGFESEIRFALMDPGATSYEIEKTEEGGTRIVTESVFEFVNETMKSTLSFINEDLVSVYRSYAKIRGWEYEPAIGGATHTTNLGIRLYKSVNGIT